MSDEPEVTTDWRESLPEQLRDAPYFKNATSPEQVRADLDGAAYWQGNSILKPTAEASDEAKATNKAKLRELYPDLANLEDPEIYTRLGKPEEHTKYETPEGLSISEDEMTSLKQIAFAADMTKKQFKEYISGLDAARRTSAEMNQTRINEQQAELRKEWGEATDARRAEVAQFLRNDTTAPAHLLKAHEEGTLSASEYKWLHNLSRAGDESPEATTHGKTADGKMTVVEGMQKAQEIREKMFKMRASDPMYKHLNNQLVEADRAASSGG